MTSSAAIGAMQPDSPLPGDDRGVVIHATGMCRPWDRPGGVPSLPLAARILDHATIVVCTVCGQPGVKPTSAEHIPQYLPSEARWDPATRAVTWTFR